MKIAEAIISEDINQPEDPRITQLLATNYDRSKQTNLRQFRLFRERKLNQSRSEIKYIRTFVSVFIHAKPRRNKAFCCSATNQKTRVFCPQSSHSKKLFLIIWIGIPVLGHYQKKMTIKNKKTVSETLLVRIALT